MDSAHVRSFRAQSLISPADAFLLENVPWKRPCSSLTGFLTSWTTAGLLRWPHKYIPWPGLVLGEQSWGCWQSGCNDFLWPSGLSLLSPEATGKGDSGFLLPLPAWGKCWLWALCRSFKAHSRLSAYLALLFYCCWKNFTNQKTCQSSQDFKVTWKEFVLLLLQLWPFLMYLKVAG